MDLKKRKHFTPKKKDGDDPDYLVSFFVSPFKLEKI